MIERAVTFGDAHTLVGVVSEPDNAREPSAAPAVVLINAGLLNRAGPNRLYVTMARALAARGYLALRFDLSGLGDSDRRVDQLSYAEGAVSDTCLAIDYLADAYGVRSVVLGGLCSGADNSFLTACDDDRVAGCILLDWYAYRTIGYFLHHYAPRLLQPGPWKRKILGQLDRLRPRRSGDHESQVDPYARDVPPRAHVVSGLGALLGRGTRLLCVYTGGQDALYNHPTQFDAMFPRLRPRELLQTEYLPEADHTFTLVRDQRRVLAIVLEWIESLATTAPASPRDALQDAG